jgi:hypothetical protein
LLLAVELVAEQTTERVVVAVPVDTELEMLIH